MTITHHRFFYSALSASVILGLASVICGQAGEGISDFQVRHETSVSIPLKKHIENGKEIDAISLVLLGTLRAGQNRLYPVDRRIGFGFDFRIGERTTLSPSYYYRKAAPLRGSNETEQRFRLDLTQARQPLPFSLKWRNRLEYRAKHGSRDSVRYRSRLTASITMRLRDKEVFSPFLAEEIFFELRDGRFSSNEFSAGISKRLNRTVAFDIFFLDRRNRTGPVTKIRGIGINLKLRIAR